MPGKAGSGMDRLSSDRLHGIVDTGIVDKAVLTDMRTIDDRTKSESERDFCRDRQPEMPVNLLPLIWPLCAAASISRATASAFDAVASALSEDKADMEEPPAWASSNRILLELQSMQLRDFSSSAGGAATVICAPFALHRATIADFAPGHSLVETLREHSSQRILVTDWRSATPEMRNLTIDNYLADLNVAVDDCRAPVNLVGLCQGGWLALIYAARFPDKVRKLVLVGAPVDVSAEDSELSRFVNRTPIEAFEQFVREGDGLIVGKRILDIWGRSLAAKKAGETLQIGAESDPGYAGMLEDRFLRWHASTVDLPGRYYLEVVRRVFKDNQIARGQFVALGRQIRLRDVSTPIFLLGGRDDDIVPENQLFALTRLVGTPQAHLATRSEPSSHLSLFLGRQVLAGAWRQIATWLNRDTGLAMAS